MSVKKASNASLPVEWNQREASGTKVLNPEHFKTFEYSGFLFRATMENGEPLFVANDICKALEYSNPRDALSRFCKGVVKRDTLSAGGMQETNFINEPDLYRLVFRSKKPEAEAFADFVYEVVLPSIRKTGQYSAQKEPDAYAELKPLLEDSRLNIRKITITSPDGTKYNVCVGQKPARSLSRTAQAVISLLLSKESGDYCYQELIKQSGLRAYQLTRAINGRDDCGGKLGLLEDEQCRKAITITKRGGRECILTWNKEAYIAGGIRQ